MTDIEHQLGAIKDILLPLDIHTRYDVYFTDKRIAIVCMGQSSRIEHGTLEHRSYLFGIAPEPLVSIENERKNERIIEEKINNLSLNEKLKLSKKSCFYTYEEIEQVKLILGKKLKFVILSEECISKFSPNLEQFKQLIDLLPNIEMLKDKTSIIGNLNLTALQAESTSFSCKHCGSKNDVDAVFCDSCGMKIKDENDNPSGLTCSTCGAKNRAQASFCKKCGTSIHA
jgi:ribosomal protein L40E